MKRIISIITQDLSTALRDNILVYMLIAPLLLSFGASMLIPSVEDTSIRFAVENSLQKELVMDLREYGEVEEYDSIDEVRNRVEKNDAIVGVVEGEGKLTLLFEGNEPQEVIDTYKAVLSNIMSNKSNVDVQHKSLDQRGSILKEFITIAMIMTTLMISGVISGFNIVAERESKAINAIAVSPLTTRGYIMARGILSNIIAIILAIGSSIILVSFNIDYSNLLIILILSSFLTTLLGLIVGAFAQNQLTAIAVIKLLTPLYVAIPMLSFLIPDRLSFLLYWLPNYWQFQALSNIYFSFPQEVTFLNASILTFITSGIYLLLFSKYLGKKLNLR
ncbi:ABC transporter permease [Alkaliphilus pronyensis]|uniref:ABC transporter permease n=1 Tax=Alkaliphilus pronyensis TaxID=1482732 RepID=A0A6I0F6V1_9FIRM|nr:ABC transporter permease [Alkaliphilus pronyensis]KAB3533500.1 ABC transporter permease [Alkaliphilus pronyensis]